MGKSHYFILAVLLAAGISVAVPVQAAATGAAGTDPVASQSVAKAKNAIDGTAKKRRFFHRRPAQQGASAQATGKPEASETDRTADLNRQSLAAAQAGQTPDLSASPNTPRTAQRSTRTKYQVATRDKSRNGRTVKVKKVKVKKVKQT